MPINSRPVNRIRNHARYKRFQYRPCNLHELEAGRCLNCGGLGLARSMYYLPLRPQERPKIGGWVMSTRVVRTWMVVVAVGGSFVTASCAGTIATGTTPSAAQYAAIADDACVGVPAKEREMGLLAYRDGIVNVTPLQEDTFAGKIKATRTEGAVIALRAMPGISVPWLEKINLCHVALVGSGRLPENEMAMDPFAIPGTKLGATEIYAGYELSVRGVNHDMSQEILRRSTALLSASGRPTTASLASSF